MNCHERVPFCGGRYAPQVRWVFCSCSVLAILLFLVFLAISNISNNFQQLPSVELSENLKSWCRSILVMHHGFVSSMELIMLRKSLTLPGLEHPYSCGSWYDFPEIFTNFRYQSFQLRRTFQIQSKSMYTDCSLSSHLYNTNCRPKTGLDLTKVDHPLHPDHLKHSVPVVRLRELIFLLGTPRVRPRTPAHDVQDD